jgi:hypothetical protein
MVSLGPLRELKQRLKFSLPVCTWIVTLLNACLFFNVVYFYEPHFFYLKTGNAVLFERRLNIQINCLGRSLVYRICSLCSNLSFIFLFTSGPFTHRCYLLTSSLVQISYLESDCSTSFLCIFCPVRKRQVGLYNRGNAVNRRMIC